MSLEKLDILNTLSPEQRAAVLNALKQKAMQGKVSVPVARADEADTAPLSPSQQSLWVLEQMHGSGAYNELAAFRIKGAVDVAVLERALLEIGQRHEILRTTFPLDGAHAVQRIAPAATLDMLRVDIRHLPAPQQDSAIADQAAQLHGTRFDLASGPLLRTVFIACSGHDSVLLVAAHHIVLDGWSIGIFRNELSALYKAFRDGAPSPLPALPLQYADYAIWQRQEAGRHEKQLNYWKQQLADIPPVLDLSVTKPRPATPSKEGGRHYFSLPAELMARLKGAAQRDDVTLFMFLLAGFQILLHRYSQQTVIAVGSATANRNHPDLEGLIGYFLNTLVMRADFTADISVAEFVRKTGETAIAAYEHQEVPFQAVVDALQPERSANHHPLFQIAFNLQNTPKAGNDKDGLELVAEPLDLVSAKFDLILWMEESADGLRGYWEYSADLFDLATLERMTGHLTTILAAMVETPSAPLSALPILTAAERRQILVDWNASDAPAPQVQCIHRLIEAQALLTPEAPAVAYEGLRLSYGELNKRANTVANYLTGQGMVAGALVGLYLERSLDMIVGLLAILKAGGAYVPLDPHYPAARSAQVLDDARPAIVLTRQRHVDGLPGGAARILSIEDARACGLDGESNPDRSADDGNALAYVIYTSGSTGIPKGVAISHRNLLHSTAARTRVYPHAPESFLLLSSIAFDSSAAGIYWTLTTGGMLVIPAEDRLQDTAYLHDLIEMSAVSHFLTIPGFHAELLRHAQPDQLGSLRSVIVAGEACPPAVVMAHFDQLPNVSLFNEYGPTEATVWATSYQCSASAEQALIPVGRPIPFTQVYILDAHRRPVPAGVAGELFIGGEGVSRGYLQRDELNAVSFVNVAIEPDRPQRLYRTGDLARWRHDGLIDVLGRTDQQIKLRGYRVELGDVESALLAHPKVGQAMAGLELGPAGEKRLVAFVTSAGAGKPAIEALFAQLAETLPSHAVPSSIILVDELPKLPNGKLDKSRLPPASAGATLAVTLTPLEQSIADVWQQILKVEKVGPDDDFFKIGGDSLLMIRVYNRLREVIGFTLPIVEMFKHPTPRQLAALIAPQVVPQTAPPDAWTPLERTIADIWQTTLKLDHVGRDDDFFKIGGDSLLMIRVYNKLRAVVDTSIPIIELFKNPTPSMLAALLSTDTVDGTI
ncbi:amino acid adenylation domain-containing protein [Massilia scottii]|uniref:amino acid adenylation domain-containing protein n=1 Tax=Massilia scottii TaxID=3057166 RepID=UPI0027966F40|nr:amino acid adenylation domain-containing protein [Massilia sp. CCM 9029]MDQ1835376.1 amino acid adenylation domain-containing protein [Massilia sp. CCM 9029]